jgi:hypothetical protein
MNPSTCENRVMSATPTQQLIVEPHFGRPGERYRHAYMPGDHFYQCLLDAHKGLGDEASEQLNARLLLLLANHIGDLSVLEEAIALAREGIQDAEGNA